MTRLLLQHPILGPETTQAKSSSSAVPCLVLGFLSSFAQVELPLEPSTHVQGQKWAENSDGGRPPNREHSFDAHGVLWADTCRDEDLELRMTSA